MKPMETPRGPSLGVIVPCRNDRRTRMLDGQDLIRQVTLDFLREKQLIPTKE